MYFLFKVSQQTLAWSH